MMNPRTHPRGAPPDFTLPTPNPNPTRQTDALWWLVCMRLALEPDSRNGGTLAIKPGYHSYGSRLPDYGQGDSRTDHSIRWSWDRTGPWWANYCSAHDWTFESAHSGNYTIIAKYVNRLINAMRDPDDLRPDDVYAYTIGQADNDLQVEGYNERTDAAETGDDSHLWHRHDSFRRNVVGDFWAMWKALTIDMGWTYAEWQHSLEDDMTLTEMKSFLASAEGKKLVAKAVWQTDDVIPSPTGSTNAFWWGQTWLNDIRAQELETRKAVGVLAASVNALGGRDFTDEPAIIAGVLAGLDPAKIAEAVAAALPQDQAQRVADELASRLSAARPPA